MQKKKRIESGHWQNNPHVDGGRFKEEEEGKIYSISVVRQYMYNWLTCYLGVQYLSIVRFTVRGIIARATAWTHAFSARYMHRQAHGMH